MDTVHVITLERTPERFAWFRRHNPHLSIVRVFGADGRKLDRDALIRDGTITPANVYAKSALGLALSHVALWRYAVQQDRTIVVAEDDAVFRRDFTAQASRIAAALPRWDIILWTWNQDWPLEVDLAPHVRSAIVHGNETRIREDLDAFAFDEVPPLALRLRSAAGTCSYAVSPAGAARLLERCLPISDLRPPYAPKPQVGWVNAGIDVELSRHYPALDAFVTLPPLAVSPNLPGQSTIAAERAGQGVGQPAIL